MGIDLPQYVHQCAPHVAKSTMLAIIKTESKGNPLAISLNKGYKLTYQPKSYEQALNWVNYLEKHKYNFDIGLAQINIANVHKFGFTASQALEPCLNLQMGAYLLQKSYTKELKTSRSEQEALFKAISAYNTGSNTLGFRNGYVNKVVVNSVGIAPY